MIHDSKQNGITLIEAILVLAILGGVSTMVILDFRRSEQRFALQNAVQQLSLDIRRAQAFTLQAREEGGSVPARYGIYIDNTGPGNSYVLFQDSDDDEIYDAPGELLETMTFPRSIQFPSLVASLRNVDGSLCEAVSQLHIAFKPPDPIVSIRGGPPVFSSCFKSCIFVNSIRAGDRIVGVTKTGLVNIYGDITACISDV